MSLISEIQRKLDQDREDTTVVAVIPRELNKVEASSSSVVSAIASCIDGFFE